LLASGEKRVLVNLTNADYPRGVYALGNLVRAYNACRKKGGELKLINPPKRWLEVLQISGLAPILAVYTDEDQAQASFECPSARPPPE
jgi:anti-anti-sigma factor